MGKYTQVQTDIYSIFASAAWQLEAIKAFPNGHVPVDVGLEYLRLNVLSGTPIVNRKSISGLLIIDIFTPLIGGTFSPVEIADKLDTYLADKSVGSGGVVTQFGASGLKETKQDSDNSSLLWTQYSIPFNHFGVI